MSYFELTVKSVALDEAETPDPIVTMGICGEFCTLDDHPGWHIWFVGYHSDNGGIFEEAISAEEHKAVFRPG